MAPNPWPSPPCYPDAVEGAIGEVEGVLARECAHVGRVVGVGANAALSRGQGDSHSMST
jgi:hypothetical protein